MRARAHTGTHTHTHTLKHEYTHNIRLLLLAHHPPPTIRCKLLMNTYGYFLILIDTHGYLWMRIDMCIDKFTNEVWQVGGVNCEAEGVLCGEHRVNAYPTFRLIYGVNDQEEYQDHGSYDGWVHQSSLLFIGPCLMRRLGTSKLVVMYRSMPHTTAWYIKARCYL